MFGELLYSVISGGIFFLLLVLYVIEDARGRRIILPKLRGYLDRVCRYVADRLLKSVIRLSVWGLHIVSEQGIKRLVRTLVEAMYKIESKIEILIRQHRTLHSHIGTDRSRTHLDDIAEHKKESALTEAERDKMREH